MLEQTWRWFGPKDPVPLDHIVQTGSSGIVSSLDHIPTGEIWTKEEILKHKSIIEASGLQWSVVESLPIHEDIKKRTGQFFKYTENYKQSIVNLAECGIKTITYNFMPVLDWCRTNLAYVVADKSQALRFDKIEFAAFDLFLLKRPGAKNEYSNELQKQALHFMQHSTSTEQQLLINNIIAGLPGGTKTGANSLEDFQEILDTYSSINADILRNHLITFLKDIETTVDQTGVHMAIHPDDPPFDLLGLPRIMSTENDLQHLINNIDNPLIGFCFCTGSFGVLPANDLPKMIDVAGKRIHFAHLRATKREINGSFYEANHLEGDVDMYTVLEKLQTIAIAKGQPIPIRPDHGHKMLDDMSKVTNPGYSAIGRLRGLAELRGIIYAITQRTNRN